MTVPELVAAQVAARPDAPAVESAQVLTYRSLDRRANALAARLRPALRGADPVVALVLDRGPDFVVAMLAAWKAGAAFCPVDPTAPADRVKFVLDDVDACAVVREVPHEEADGEFPAPSPSSTAYVLYTSGTTGTPKGVEVTHANLANLVSWFVTALGLTPDDRASHLGSVGFDVSQIEVWPYLAAGACVVPHEPPVVAADVPGWLRDRRITRAMLVTPLAETVWALGEPLPSLRSMMIGGAALARPLPELPYPVHNFYGPTECTVLATAHLLSTGDGNVIGRPIGGVDVEIIDGEIHIRGAAVARGYRGRPTVTRQRFTPSGYRTGDRGRWRPDGTIEYLGRQDRQIKVRGHRIEPGDVEARLCADPLVANAVVRGTSDGLLAYLVPRPGAAWDTSAVLDRLAGWVAVTPGVVWLDEFPLTANGKVDVDALPQPARAVEYVEPVGEVERRIARVWSTVLKVDEVGLHDNFFDLGGNSLLLAALRAGLQAELGTPVPMTVLFARPTVGELARALGPAEGGAPDGDAPDGDDAVARARRARARRRA
ncbi:AMP-binding protein [Actinosynnema sp. NPDC091369]